MPSFVYLFTTVHPSESGQADARCSPIAAGQPSWRPRQWPRAVLPARSQRRLASWRCIATMCALFWMLCSGGAQAVTITFDYAYDSTSFFDPVSHPGRREALELAADSVNRWVDPLAAIIPSGGNSWTGQVVRPDTGQYTFIPGSQLSVPTGSLRIYVGAANYLGSTHLSGSFLNLANPVGSDAWKALVNYRGQTPGVDFGPWSGTVVFNPNFDWYFGANAGGLLSTQYDFITAASHELIHQLGFGTSASYNALVQAGQFIGPKAIAVGSWNNPNLEISPEGFHWAGGTQSTVGGVNMLSPISPFVPIGQRLRLTDLDAAALDDIGWQAATPGDINLDGVVDIFDTNVVSSHWNESGPRGDANHDGIVDIFDINLISAHWTTGGGGGGVTAVPEPPSWVAAGLASLAIVLVFKVRGPAGCRTRLPRGAAP